MSKEVYTRIVKKVNEIDNEDKAANKVQTCI